MRTVFNDGQEITYQDLSAIVARGMGEIYDRSLYELMGRQQGIVFGDSFLVTNVNGTTSKVKLGNGMQYDSSQTDPEPKTRPLYVAADTNVSHTAADSSHNRIDIICIQAALAAAITGTRNYKDPSSGAVTTASMTLANDWASALVVTAGTPGVSPVVPSTPAGYIKLAEVLVTASTGISGGTAYTDKRPRFIKNKRNVKTVNFAASPYQLDADDDILLIDCTAGAVQVLGILATAFGGKSVKMKKVDSTANAATFTCAGSDLADGQASISTTNQYTGWEILGDGTTLNIF